jgi:hypothetical protein
MIQGKIALLVLIGLKAQRKKKLPHQSFDLCDATIFIVADSFMVWTHSPNARAAI